MNHYHDKAPPLDFGRLLGDHSHLYDRCGDRLSLQSWVQYQMDPGYREICFDVINRRRRWFLRLDTELVFTRWTGINHQLIPGGPPLIFETVVVGGIHDQTFHRYPTETKAREGHARIVDALRNGQPPAVSAVQRRFEHR